MVHISSFKQQEICSWYRYVENCSSENMVKKFGVFFYPIVQE